MLRYRPALDGVRGFAILAVVAFHSIGGFRGGALGVDVFFVLSGFLITSLLLVEHEERGRIDFRTFYIRRALRLGPGLAVMLCLAGLLTLDDRVRATITTNVAGAFVATALYVNNWLNVAVPNSTGPVGHAWSLSVEEQFYVLWPLLLVWLLHRRTPLGWRLVAAIVAFVVARALWWVTTHNPDLGFATTSRADQLLLGALAAWLVRRQALQVGWRPAALCGAALMACCVLLDATRDRGPLNLGGLTSIAVLGAVLVVHAGTEDHGPVVWLLSRRPLVAVGKVSYGLYLYHWPVFLWVATRPGWGHPKRFVVEYTATALITVMSYIAVERPALRLKRRWEPGVRESHVVRPNGLADMS